MIWSIFNHLQKKLPLRNSSCFLCFSASKIYLFIYFLCGKGGCIYSGGYWNAVFYGIKLITESPNHRTVWAKMNLFRSFWPNPCSEKVQLVHVVHGIVQLSEQFQSAAVETPQISQSVPQGSILSLNQVWISCVATSAYCVLSFHWDECGSVIFISFHQVFIESSKIFTSAFFHSRWLRAVSAISSFISWAPAFLSTCWTWYVHVLLLSHESRTGHSAPNVPKSVSTVPSKG